ncbi:hypothetical protein [Facklamia hominis]|uniref:Uncharacterized protein n=1 Tax=Facklamia hominis TaxID=178214 RepID=A0AAJ1Q7H8_9LACT|nr:hypothetical protein [Facklamia hominis]MDK7187965.1 hypothetical protein [Facklamia hominis]
MDGNQLKAQIVLKGLKIEEFLSRVSRFGKLDRNKYYRVMRGEDEFDRSEIIAISKALNLNEEDMMRIFFKD